MLTESQRFAKSDFELVVSDIKQYAYCPRIPFYRYALPVERRPTFKMEHGKAEHLNLERLESRRKLRRYGLDAGERLFNVSLRSLRLGLAGKLDLLIRTPDADYPVEFKHTEGGVSANHRLQLVGYGLLAEEHFGRPVGRGFVYLIPKDDVEVVEFTPEQRQTVLAMIAEVRNSVVSERMPAPTPVRGRCVDCEYRNYCGDVW
jgi:CRISPR-associated exonuclease Cas4